MNKSVAILAMAAFALPALGQDRAGDFLATKAPASVAGCTSNSHVPLPDDTDNKLATLFGQLCNDSSFRTAAVSLDRSPLNVGSVIAHPMLQAAPAPHPFEEEWDRLPSALLAVLPKAFWGEADLLPVAFLPPGAEILTMADALDHDPGEAHSFHSRPYAFIPPPAGEERDIVAAPQKAPVATSTSNPPLTLPVTEVGLIR